MTRGNKVVLIAFHEALNYGAVLQAYALKGICQDLEYEAHIVDYRYGGIEEIVAPAAKIGCLSFFNCIISSIR